MKRKRLTEVERAAKAPVEALMERLPHAVDLAELDEILRQVRSGLDAAWRGHRNLRAWAEMTLDESERIAQELLAEWRAETLERLEKLSPPTTQTPVPDAWSR